MENQKKNMEFRKGTQNDLNEISMLYNNLIDYLVSHVNYPGWKKDIYPTSEDAFKGIKEHNLYVVTENNKIVSTFILRHTPEKEYRKAEWHVNIDYKDIYVVYTLAVHPEHIHRGVGQKSMEFIIELSKKQNMKAIRLDVYDKNIPAMHLYEKMGFDYIDTIDLGYSQYGLDHFCLYQKIITE